MNKLGLIFGVIFFLSMSMVVGALTDGLVAYYPLDESSGNSVDNFGSYTLTLTGSATTSSGIIGNSRGYFSKDGDNSLKNCSFPAPATIAQNYSTNVWLYIANTPVYDTIYTIGPSFSSNQGITLFAYNASSLDFQIFGSNTYIDGIKLNTWYMVTVVLNSSESKALLYLNGAFVNKTASYSGYTSAYANWISIGSLRACDDHYDGFNLQNGTVDELRVWNRTLSQTEITGLYSLMGENIICTSCNPPVGDSIVPYETDDTTPTFRFYGSSYGCRIGDQNVNYTTMGSSRNCTYDSSLSTYTCTLTAQDGIVNYNTTIYVGCNYYENSTAQYALPMLISALEPINTTEAIMQGIENSVIGTGATIYSNQKVYLRKLDGTTFTNTVDKVAVYGNQRWILNYENTTALGGMFNLTPVVYSLDMKNMSIKAIRANVTAFINSTKI